ncbi:MAG: hypothetical protein ABFD54_11855 [Armatimonadota bacterium]|nr:hypothetical protein [bacterium]
MKTTLFVVITLILTLPAFADKVTVDPNTIKAPAVETDPVKLDSRLAQKVTYTSTNKRLHSIVDDIVKQTGVMIYCGKSKEDWQVRDLPLVVCTNELPLGKLLRGLVDATQLALTSTTVKGEKQYRIIRDPVQEKLVEDYYKKLPEAGLAHANWEWDAMIKLASLPDNLPEPKQELSQDYSRDRSRDPIIRSLAKVMAALPPGTRERVFAGERVMFKASDVSSPVSVYIDQLYREVLANLQQDMAKFAPEMKQPQFSEADLQTATLAFHITDGEYPSLHPDLESRNGNGICPINYDPGLRDELKDRLPEQPKDPEPPSAQCAPCMQGVAINYGEGSPWGKKIKVEKPKDENATVADNIVAIAKASGFSIICEDFRSHKQAYGDSFVADNGETLVNCIFYMQNEAQVSFWIDQDSKLLVGTSHRWYDLHRKLAPINILNHLYDKLNSDGVELDDAMMILDLPQGAASEWIYDSRDLSSVAWSVNERSEPFWKLYNALSAEDKALAKSEAGLALFRLDLNYLVDVFRKGAKGAAKEETRDEFDSIAKAMHAADPELHSRITPWLEKWVDEHYPGMRGSDGEIPVDRDAMAAAMLEQFPELKRASQIPTDPSAIAKLTLRINKHEQTPFVTTVTKSTDRSETIRHESRPDGFKKHMYDMSIKGDDVNLQIDGPYLMFPVYSPERAAELQKEMQKNSEKTE